MRSDCATYNRFEMSPRFRRSIEERIARLDGDAEQDEARIKLLVNRDRIRRQMRLVAVQRADALRLRLFLDRMQTRVTVPSIAL